MPYTHNGFSWEVPAHVLAVLDGRTFLARADLGWNVSINTIVVVDGLIVPPIEERGGLAARKEAQRLLNEADVFLRTRRMFSYHDQPAVIAEVAYGPDFTLRSEQASFKTAMIASGHGKTITRKVIAS